MAGLDDLSRSDLGDILRRLRALETAAPLQNASIGASGLRVYAGGVITIENGGLNVTGTATISGVLNADGTVTLSGDVTISGPFTVSGNTDITGDLTVTGPTHLNGTTDVAGNTTVTGDFTTNGPMKTTGTLSVEGVTTLKNDLNVTTGGKITAGNIIIDPSADNGGVMFATGGGIGGNAGTVLVAGDNNAGLIVSDTADLFAGSTQLSVGDGSLRVDGLPTRSGVTANLYMDPATQQIYRVT